MQKIVDDEKKKKDDELKAKEKEELVAKVQCQEVIEAAIIDVNSGQFDNDKNR